MILQRPLLIARNILANRERPDLEALGRIEDPENFVWAILPHAARTFSAAIVGSSRVDLQACKLEYSIVSPK